MPPAQPVNPPVRLSEAEQAVLRFPALAWLDGLLDRAPGANVILAFMPVHVAVQLIPGSLAAARDEACKAQVAAIGARHGAAVVASQRPWGVTIGDSNYWDALHYRQGVAERIVKALRTAQA